MVFLSCNKDEVSLEEISALRTQYAQEIFKKTKFKPGPPEYKIGQFGGTYYMYIPSDPKSFNTLNARDGITGEVTNHFYPHLFSYDPYVRKLKADNASFEIRYDEDEEITYVKVTLRSDLYWTTANGRKEQITADDLIFWYYEVEGDPNVQHHGYSSQFVTNKQEEKKRIELIKDSKLGVTYKIPVILADPALHVNGSFGPRYIFEPAKKERGVNGLLDVLSIDINPKDVPSAGKYMLSEFQSGQYVVLVHNPNYWKRDAKDNAIPYIEKIFIRVIASEDAALLSFKQGNLTNYNARPEDLDTLLNNPDTYDVYNAGASLSSVFITFNQNPNVLDEYKYKWFSNKYFRQAMSSLLPRERIVREVYRGLAEPAHYFFAKANMFFDENISLKYRFDPQRAKELLKKGGFSWNNENKVIDQDGNLVKFGIYMGVENTVNQDVASLFAEELGIVGITLDVQPIDFQNLVERLTKNYQWDSVMVALGPNYFPSSGSNVWQSNSNFHLWYPLQKTPATEWEARIDTLYQQGQSTIDKQERKTLYDEYQTILLEQLPFIYIVYKIRVAAYDKRVQNLFLDNLQGSEFEYLYFSE